MNNNEKPHRPGWGWTQHEDAVVQYNSTLIYVGSKVVGRVLGDTFQKTIRKDHFLQKPPAIAFDIDSLYKAEQAGAVKVQVTDRDSGQIYSALLSLIRSKGFLLNRGYGDQIALPMHEWKCDDDTVQLALF